MWLKVSLFAPFVVHAGIVFLVSLGQLPNEWQYYGLILWIIPILLLLSVQKRETTPHPEDATDSILSGAQLSFLLGTSTLLWLAFMKFKIPLNLLFIIPIIQAVFGFYVMNTHGVNWRRFDKIPPLVHGGFRQLPFPAVLLFLTLMTTLVPGMVIVLLWDIFF